MKELSIEEKAKAYDEAIKRAQAKMEEAKVFDYDDEQTSYTIRLTTTDIFPELKESEDERIGREIIDFLKHTEGQTIPLQKYNAWIAWLEKQGEHANFRNKIQIGDKVTRNEDGVLVNLSQLKRVAKPEQKPVVSLDENGEPILTDFESALFTTISYFWQSYNSGEEINIAEFAKEYAPELLEAANKQLKPAWSEEDEERLSDAIFFVREYQIPTRDKRLLYAAKETEDWLRTFKDRVQPKQEWSEEDERYTNIVVSALSSPYLERLYHFNDVKSNDIINWFESLKERYTWKPSDEQIYALRSVVSKLKHSDNNYAETIEDLYNDLEKLREE